MAITIYTVFSTKHEESWKNQIADELNTLLGRAVYFRETSNDELDQAAEAATLSIVERVANFEEIRRREARSRS